MIVGRNFSKLSVCLFYILVEASESYWKLMTERRRRAIDETNLENQHVTFMNISFIKY
jgi:hypothetical protein